MKEPHPQFAGSSHSVGDIYTALTLSLAVVPLLVPPFLTAAAPCMFLSRGRRLPCRPRFQWPRVFRRPTPRSALVKDPFFTTTRGRLQREPGSQGTIKVAVKQRERAQSQVYSWHTLAHATRLIAGGTRPTT